MTYPANGEIFISHSKSGDELHVGRALDAHLCTDYKGYWRPFEGTSWLPCNVPNGPKFRVLLDTVTLDSDLVVEFEKDYVVDGTKYSCEPGIYFKVECIR